MGKAAAWVGEILFRLLGVLSKASLVLRRVRVLFPLSWVVFLVLLSGAVALVRVGWDTLTVYRAPLRSIQELAESTADEGQYYHVQALAYHNVYYTEILTYTSMWAVTRHVVGQAYLLLDPDTSWGMIVLRAEPPPPPSQVPQEPVARVVAGRLMPMERIVYNEVFKTVWSDYGITMSRHRVLEEAELRFPTREILLLLLCGLVAGFLLLTRWFDYIIFRPQPNAVANWPADPAVDPFGRHGMQVTAALPIIGTRRRVQLVESLAALRSETGGLKVVTNDPDSPSDLSILLPRDGIVQVTPGRVYLGWKPRWGLWVVYRDPRGTLRRLSLSFYGTPECRVVYDLLTGRSGVEAGAAGGPPAEKGATQT